MNLDDFIIAPPTIVSEKWQLGSLISNEIKENGLVLLFVSDFRGAGGGAEILDFSPVRRLLYRLSALDFEVPVCDLGDLVSGRSIQDSHYAIQEVLSLCHYKNAVPLIIGGSADFAYSLFSALNFHYKEISYTQITNKVSLSGEGEEISEKNYLHRIFSTKNFSLKNFHLLGYQKHLNEEDSVKLIREVDFDIVRLAEMMNGTAGTEPFFRRADLVTLDCNAVESFSEPFSVQPQVNGLNRREVCAYMKEMGLSEKLKSAGIFNFDFETGSLLNNQLLAQMVWYFIEGVNIQRSHPKERHYETFYVMVDDSDYTFKRDTFSGLWYFGSDDKVENCISCSAEDYENAKKGHLNFRLLKRL